ncbi:MAG: helix-turn-helix domain-containing protein [Bacteroidetes bacterium]|nr:helix-turn-helix domain-containing protein [Bacteroidota bacterium]
MVLNQFPPAPILNNFIRVYRVVHCVFDNTQIIPFKPYPPKPEHCLSFYPRDTEVVTYTKSGKKNSNIKAVVFGQQNEVTNRHVGKDFLLFQVVFKPGALYRFLGIPSTEITNCYIDAETVFPAAAIKEVNDRLASLGTDFLKMVAVIDAFLVKQLPHLKAEAHQIDFVSNNLVLNNEGHKIENQAKASCLSLRQYERKFLERMGVSPKYFSKVVRFEHAFRMKNKFPNLDWLTIALHCGYYDYQHLVKDYKELTLQSPTEFHLLDLSSPERKFGEADTY